MKTKLFIGFVALVLIADGIMGVIALQDSAAAANVGQNKVYGAPYAVTTNYHDLYFDRVTYCHSDLTGANWQITSFGIDGHSYPEECILNG